MPFFGNIRSIIPDEARELGELYHENSKLSPQAGASLGRWIGGLLRNPATRQILASGYKTYPAHPRISLPEPAPLQVEDLSRLVRTRRSILTDAEDIPIDPRPVTPEALSRLLADGYGITGAHRLDVYGVEIEHKLRAAPSGGGLYPLELYPLVRRGAEELAEGVYHYDVAAHGLEKLAPAVSDEDIGRLTANPVFLRRPPLILVVTAVFGRSYFKYWNRGYRFVLIEAGHVAQNLYLLGTALGLGVVAIGGFYDDAVNALLDIDGVNESALYLIAFGRLRNGPPASPTSG